LIDFGSETQNLESYPPIRPIIVSALINGVCIQGPADTGASANFIKDVVVAENNFQTRKSAVPSYVHQPLSDTLVKLSDGLFANVSIPAEDFTTPSPTLFKSHRFSLIKRFSGCYSCRRTTSSLMQPHIE